MRTSAMSSGTSAAAAAVRRLTGARTAPAFRHAATRFARTTSQPPLARVPAFFSSSTSSLSPVSSASSAPRYYHSYDHPNEAPAQDSFSAAETAILTAAARHIPEHGFTEHTIGLGVHEAGYPGISANILPDGVFTLVRWHLVGQRNALAARSREIFGADESDLQRPPAEVAERVERLLWERLLGNRAVIARWQEALAIMAQPSYVTPSLRELALLADEVWALAGDRAVDPSWYTKRAAISAIYASSELFMTTDTSPDFAATREFLHRRLKESRDLGGAVRSVGEFFGFAASAGVNVLRSKGVSI